MSKRFQVPQYTASDLSAAAAIEQKKKRRMCGEVDIPFADNKGNPDTDGKNHGMLLSFAYMISFHHVTNTVRA